MRRRDRLAAAPLLPPPQPPGFEFVIIFAAESKIFALDPFVGGEGEFIKPPRRLASLL